MRIQRGPHLRTASKGGVHLQTNSTKGAKPRTSDGAAAQSGTEACTARIRARKTPPNRGERGTHADPGDGTATGEGGNARECSELKTKTRDRGERGLA